MNKNEILDKEIKHTNTPLFKSIRVLIILGTIFGIHPFLIIISTPLYFSGVILLWVKIDIKRNLKLKWTLYPLIVIICIWILLTSNFIGWLLSLFQ